jgi:hypothetical protein
VFDDDLPAEYRFKLLLLAKRRKRELGATKIDIQIPGSGDIGSSDPFHLAYLDGQF